MVEVAGISPAKPGWEVIRFQPRIELYSELKARVPIRRRDEVEGDFANVQ